MESLKGILAVIFFVSGITYTVIHLMRPWLIAKKAKVYQDGVKTDIKTPEELKEIIRRIECFLVKQTYYDEYGNVVIEGKAGTHTLYLEDGYIRTKRDNVTDSRKQYNFIVEENMLLELITKEEKRILPVNPVMRYKKQMRLTKMDTISLVSLIASIFLLLIVVLMPTDKDYIDAVRKTSPEAYPNVTYEQAFDNFFGNGKWEYFKTSDGTQIVEFDGKATYGGEPADVCFQFTLDMENEQYQLQYMDIDGVSQDWFSMAAMLDTIFSDYE